MKIFHKEEEIYRKGFQGWEENGDARSNDLHDEAAHPKTTKKPAHRSP